MGRGAKQEFKTQYEEMNRIEVKRFTAFAQRLLRSAVARVEGGGHGGPDQTYGVWGSRNESGSRKSIRTWKGGTSGSSARELTRPFTP
jgi:hypothetical protein